MIGEGIISKLSNVLTSLVKPEPKPTTTNTEAIPIRIPNISSSSNGGTGSNTPQGKKHNRRNLNNFDFKNKDFLEVGNKKHSPSSSISSVYSYNSDISALAGN